MIAKVQPDPKKRAGLVGFVDIPSEIMEEGISLGAWIVISILILITIIMIVGIVVQYTNLGNKPGRDHQQSRPEDSKLKWALFFYAFNPVVNLQKLFYVKGGGDQRLAVLNGVRVLSIGWVILGHGFGYFPIGAVTNMGTVMKMVDNPSFSIIAGGYFAVDTFFFLSGFLTFAIMTQKLYPKGGWAGFKNTFLIYFHRYYRLIFPIIFTILLLLFLVRYLGSGPSYRQMIDAASYA